MKPSLKRIDSWPRQAVSVMCIWFVTLVGLADYLTGYETFFFTFYVLAIFLGTWRVNAAFGVWISALSVTAWVSANIQAGERYANYFVPVWNAAIMFAIYIIIVFLISRLKKIHGELEERVQLRTNALTREIQERKRLQKELLEMTDREHRRLSRNLHDGLCQHLTGTALAGHFLQQKLIDKSPVEAREAARLVLLVEEAIEQTRNLSHELDPVELKAGKLTDHLADLAAQTSQRCKVDCRFACSLSQPPSEAAVITHLYRIARAAVGSAVKDSGAKQINISLDSVADEVVLSIMDDGNGQAGKMPDDRDAGGRAMAYRADLIGATLNIERLNPRGNRVACVLPPAGIHHGGKN